MVFFIYSSLLKKRVGDQNKRLNYYKLEYLKKIYKVVFISLLNIPKFNQKKPFFYKKFFKIKQRIRRISKIQIKNRCIISNRNKSVIRPFFLSRIKLKEYIHLGLLPGCQKAVW